MDRIWRMGFYIAHRMMRVVRFVTGIAFPGSFVAVWCDDHILLLRTSYQPFHTLPGGMANWRESPEACAVRELGEEVGIHLDAQQLERIPDSPMQRKLKRDRIALFRVRVDTMAPPPVDGREIVWAGYVPRTDPRIQELWPPFRAYVEACRQ